MVIYDISIRAMVLNYFCRRPQILVAQKTRRFWRGCTQVILSDIVDVSLRTHDGFATLYLFRAASNRTNTSHSMVWV